MAGPKTKMQKRIEMNLERERAECKTPPEVLPKKKTRGKNKPKPVTDYRPIILEFFRDKKPLDIAWAELEKYGHTLRVKDRLNFYMAIARMGLEASPRTIEGAIGPTIIFDMGGMVPKETPLDAIDVTPQPPALPYSERLPVGSARDQAFSDAAARERDRVAQEQAIREGQAEVDGKVEDGVYQHDIFEVVSRKLNAEDQALREENIQRVKQGLKPLNETRPLGHGSGIKDC